MMVKKYKDIKKNSKNIATDAFLWVEKEQIDKEYAIPSAFGAYKKHLL